MNGSSTATYTYNHNGLRMLKNVEGTTWHYIWHGDQLTHVINADGLHFYYDGTGRIIAYKVEDIVMLMYEGGNDMPEIDLLSNWQPSLHLYEGSVGDFLRQDYLSLLSVGIPDDEAERRVIDDYREIRDGSPVEAEFWFALADTEWKKGRLSTYVYSKAIEYMDNGAGLKPWQSGQYPAISKYIKERERILAKLRQQLSSPMPSRKGKAYQRPTSSIWHAGDLLAWRIQDKTLENSPLYGKYFLARVVTIDRKPLCRLALEAGFCEDPVIGAYKWCGDHIPSPETAKDLDFLVVFNLSMLNPQSLSEGIADKLKNMYPDVSSIMIDTLLRNMTTTKRVTCCLVYTRKKDIKALDVTCIGHDESFTDRIPSYLDTSITSMTICSVTQYEGIVESALLPFFGK